MENNLPVEIVERGEALEQVKTQYHTAVRVQRPRDLAVVQENVLKEASLAGKAFYYMWQVKSKGGGTSYVKGPSIGLMMAIAREYTNCAVVPTVDETEDAYYFKASFVDIEKGMTIGRIFRQSKDKNIGSKYDVERQKDIVFQIGQSKAIRNVINSAVPKWLTDQAVERAIEAESGGITRDNLKAKVESCLTYFSQKGVDEGRILAHIGKARGMISKDDMIYLGGLRSRLDDGEPIDSVIPPVVTEQVDNSPKVEDMLKDKEPEKEKTSKGKKSKDKSEPQPTPEEPAYFCEGCGQQVMSKEDLTDGICLTCIAIAAD